MKHVMTTRLRCCAFLVLATPLVLSPTQAQEDARTLRAGAATSNITPPLGQPIVGGWSPIPAKHIHDELHARCLVLDDGKTRIVFVVCDNVGIPREVFDRARTWIGEETDLAPGDILMCATHTHSATSARGTSPVGGDPLSDYSRFLARRIADGVRRAVNNLEPATIGWGRTQAPEHVFNRRWFMKPGPELGNPFGGRDKVRMKSPTQPPEPYRARGTHGRGSLLHLDTVEAGATDRAPGELLAPLRGWSALGGRVSRLLRRVRRPHPESPGSGPAEPAVRRDHDQRYQRQHQQHQFPRGT